MARPGSSAEREYPYIDQHLIVNRSAGIHDDHMQSGTSLIMNDECLHFSSQWANFTNFCEGFLLP